MELRPAAAPRAAMPARLINSRLSSIGLPSEASLRGRSSPDSVRALVALVTDESIHALVMAVAVAMQKAKPRRARRRGFGRCEPEFINSRRWRYAGDSRTGSEPGGSHNSR